MFKPFHNTKIYFFQHVYYDLTTLLLDNTDLKLLEVGTVVSTKIIHKHVKFLRGKIEIII